MKDPVDDYVAEFAPDDADTIRLIHGAVTEAGPGLDVRVSYRMLLYTLGERRRDWVVALGVTKKAVTLRFLRADLMSDPDGVFRPGTSTMSTIDFKRDEPVDTGLVKRYVAEAVRVQPAK